MKVGMSNTVLAVDQLPHGYCQVEWLEGTGTQYITTDVLPTPSMTFSIECAFATSRKDNIVPFGVRDSGDWNTYDSQVMFQWYNKKLRLYSTNIDRVDLAYDTGVDIPEEGKMYSFSDMPVVETLKPMTHGIQLFGLWKPAEGPSPGFGLCKIKHFTVKDHGKVVCDIVPVKDSGGEGFMYDRTGMKLYGNRGTGSFAVGPECSQL